MTELEHKLLDSLIEANDCLRSSASIASRDGANTDWEKWREWLDRVLASQHLILLEQNVWCPVPTKEEL